ncbi:hypothetical protein [Parachitinimonas caeni]|uniref:Uncharacterized protein n=1 Tax=Parachitinimonas caeni TaxID=3031301 RepID=A0ABT7DXT3_9NEIS|nr:hypothetical protein [Parachitinimonas caeni]MDK2123893.1 hypothetical protein [Parachitinimonas caeni]
MFFHESVPSKVERYLAAHAYAEPLITEHGERYARWLDLQADAVLYLLAKESFAHGIAFYELLLCVGSYRLHCHTSGHAGPGASAWQLHRVITTEPVPDQEKDRLTKLLQNAARAYMTWYDEQFWGCKGWDSQLIVNSQHAIWTFEACQGQAKGLP